MTEQPEAQGVSPGSRGDPTGQAREILLRALEQAAAVRVEGERKGEASNVDKSRQRDAALRAGPVLAQGSEPATGGEHRKVQEQDLIVDARQAAAALLEQARVEADAVRRQSLAVIEGVKAAMVDRAREMLASEVIRLRQEAIEEAHEVKAAIIDSAREEAQRIRSEGEREEPTPASRDSRPANEALVTKLDILATDLARLEGQVAVLRAEHEFLRGLAEPTAAAPLDE